MNSNERVSSLASSTQDSLTIKDYLHKIRSHVEDVLSETNENENDLLRNVWLDREDSVRKDMRRFYEEKMKVVQKEWERGKDIIELIKREIDQTLEVYSDENDDIAYLRNEVNRLSIMNEHILSSQEGRIAEIRRAEDQETIFKLNQTVKQLMDEKVECESHEVIIQQMYQKHLEDVKEIKKLKEEIMRLKNISANMSASPVSNSKLDVLQKDNMRLREMVKNLEDSNKKVMGDFEWLYKHNEELMNENEYLKSTLASQVKEVEEEQEREKEEENFDERIYLDILETVQTNRAKRNPIPIDEKKSSTQSSIQSVSPHSPYTQSENDELQNFENSVSKMHSMLSHVHPPSQQRVTEERQGTSHNPSHFTPSTQQTGKYSPSSSYRLTKDRLQKFAANVFIDQEKLKNANSYNYNYNNSNYTFNDNYNNDNYHNYSPQPTSPQQQQNKRPQSLMISPTQHTTISPIRRVSSSNTYTDTLSTNYTPPHFTPIPFPSSSRNPATLTSNTTNTPPTNNHTTNSNSPSPTTQNLISNLEHELEQKRKYVFNQGNLSSV